MSSDLDLGLSGIVGLDTNPFQHIIKYSRLHRNVGVALGDIGHDAAAVLLDHGRPVFAVEEERLTRTKHFMGLPTLSAEACARHAGVGPEAMHVSYYLNPDADHLERRMQACAPYVSPHVLEAMRVEFADAQDLIGAHRRAWPALEAIDHHLAHAASAFYLSGFDRSLILVVDGQGESGSTSLFLGDDHGIHSILELGVASSLGLLYAAITAYLGFEPIEDEYKIMGLAAYGESDDFRGFFDGIIQAQPNGEFVIPSLLATGIERLQQWSRSLGMPRGPTDAIEPRHIAIAHSLQKATERTVFTLLRTAEEKHKTRRLCLAGGVALNCSMNGEIDRSSLFDRIFVQPAAGDPGAALGAAVASYHRRTPNAPRARLADMYLGPGYDDAAVRRALDSFDGQIIWTQPADYVGEVAKLLSSGCVVGWFQGRMEFGPRALGNRSILADARRTDMKDRVNKAVKKREEFRPFAPSVIDEAADSFFELRSHEQYEHMTIAVRAKPDRAKEIPSVVHVNGTARVQVVKRAVNPGYWEVIHRFGELTGVPLVLNTSFNVKGEPIVCTPEDAIRCFLGTGLDHLALQGYVVSKPS